MASKATIFAHAAGQQDSPRKASSVVMKHIHEEWETLMSGQCCACSVQLTLSRRAHVLNHCCPAASEGFVEAAPRHGLTGAALKIAGQGPCIQQQTHATLQGTILQTQMMLAQWLVDLQALEIKQITN